MEIRIPKDAEYLKLCSVTNGNDALMHWDNMGSWVNDTDKPLPFGAECRTLRGFFTPRFWFNYSASNRYVTVGFRPTVEGLNADALHPDNGLVVLGTLYMDGKPVEVPQNPICDGDVADYIPGAVLEMRAPLDDPDYQVKGFILGDGVAIVDRVLLKRISYEDVELSIKKEKEE